LERGGRKKHETLSHTGKKKLFKRVTEKKEASV